MKEKSSMRLMNLSNPLVVLTFLCLIGSNVTAQSNQDYTISWDTETSFDQIPFGNLVGYVFSSVAFAKEHDVFDSHELSLIYSAYMEKPKLERTYRLFEEGCNWYQESGADSDLNLEYLGNLLHLASQYESEDNNAPYLITYEKLSHESKRFVLDRIESLRGSNLMSSSTTDFVKYFRDRPEAAKRLFDRLCERIPAMLEKLENWPEQKTFENDRAIRID